jgi:Ca-activated chloride channel family protein
MRCEYCGLLQDEPAGVKSCARCGGELRYEKRHPKTGADYLSVQMELDQVAAPAGQNVERYLLVTLHTPKEVPPEEMPSASHSRPPVNFSAVLDVSGSMQGEKLTQAKLAIRQAAQYLRPGDVFSLVTFESKVASRFKPTLVDDKTSQAVEACLETIYAGGMTALDGGLERGIQKALVHKLETNLVMLLSDGQTNVGEEDLEVIGARALKAREQGILASALGIGEDYNEALLTEIATQGGGRFYHVQNASQISAYVAGELGEVAMLAAKDARIHLAIPQGATLVPLSAAYPVVQSGEEAVVTAGDIPCDTELEIPLRLALVGGSAGSKLSIDGRLSFRSPAGHDLEVPLNRVTVRFMARGQFGIREGVVAPVVERVLSQMRAASVLGVSRTMAHKPEEAERHTKTSLDALRAYASLLGEERAEKEVIGIKERFSNLRASPAMAKNMVADAYTAQRGSKKFGRKP